MTRTDVDTDLAAARRLYEAFEAHDAPGLLAELDPAFRGVTSAGMPYGLGRVYDGPHAMLRDCWAKVFALLDARPVPDEFLPAGPARMVVIGRYVGTVRDTGRELDAAFAHVLRFTDGRISEVLQITDTARWHDALAP